MTDYTYPTYCVWAIYPGHDSIHVRLTEYGSCVGEVGMVEDDPIICEAFRILASKRLHLQHGLFIFNTPHWVYAYKQDGKEFIRVY